MQVASDGGGYSQEAAVGYGRQRRMNFWYIWRTMLQLDPGTPAKDGMGPPAVDRDATAKMLGSGPHHPGTNNHQESWPTPRSRGTVPTTCPS